MIRTQRTASGLLDYDSAMDRDERRDDTNQATDESELARKLKLVRSLRGKLKGPSMADELIRQRREDKRKEDEKWR
jgi:hypothetical protein